jgi:hypothetical protein
MISNLKIFENKNFGKLTVIEKDGEFFFIANEVATMLGYVNPRKAVYDHVDEEDNSVTKWNAIGGIQNISIINESGLYLLILSSKLPQAKIFKAWVTREVLPSIRKNGGYIAGQEKKTNEELLADAILVANRIIAEREEEIEELRPKADYYDKNDEKALEEVYVLYMNNDTTGLLSDDFDYMIDDMKEQGKIVENVSDIEEKDDLINLVGNIAGEVENLERENANGEKFKVSNFSLVSKDDDGNKIYTNCSAYGDKTKDLESLKQGDFVKIFGQVKTSIDNNGKEHKNVRILSSKLLKAKEQVMGKNKGEKKESILEAINEHKKLQKQKNVNKPEQKFESER